MKRFWLRDLIVGAIAGTALGLAAYSIYDACSAEVHADSVASAVPQSQPSPAAAASPAPAVTFYGTNFDTVAEKGQLAIAQPIIARVVASQCFGDFITARPMVQTNGLTAAQVLANLRGLRGAVPVDFYYPPIWKRWLHNNVEGYEVDHDPVIHVNASLVTGFAACDFASLLAHEALGHKLGGYEHDFNPTARRPFSVPYSINAGFTACCH